MAMIWLRPSPRLTSIACCLVYQYLIEFCKLESFIYGVVNCVSYEDSLSNPQIGFGISIASGKWCLKGGPQSSARVSEVTRMPMHWTHLPSPEIGHFKFNSKGVTKGRQVRLAHLHAHPSFPLVSSPLLRYKALSALATHCSCFVHGI